MEKRMELKDAGEDDEWLVPIQKAIQESCREARSAEADTEKKGDDETDIKLLLEEHDMFLEEMDPEPTPREPDDIDDYQNNNRQQVAKSVEVRQRNVQVKRKHEENPSEEGLKNPKRPRTEKTPKPVPASENREAEEVNEEKLRREFVAKELRKEELEAEAERAARCQQMVNEIEINVFLREQRNRTMEKETENKLGQENVDDGPEGSQNQIQNQEDIEYKYVTCHDELAYKVNEGKTTQRLVSYEEEREVEQERAISPLNEKDYEEVVQ